MCRIVWPSLVFRYMGICVVCTLSECPFVGGQAVVVVCITGHRTSVTRGWVPLTLAWTLGWISKWFTSVSRYPTKGIVNMVPLTILFNISMPQVTDFAMLVVLCAMGDSLGSACLNEVIQMSSLLWHENFVVAVRIFLVWSGFCGWLQFSGKNGKARLGITI